MCGELDSLETDVATGRAEIEKTALDSKDARMEVSSFCDVEGLRIVLRVADANARAVENGFAGGIGTECYFAPGAQLSAIRRRLVYDTCRTWNRAGHGRLSPFDRWRDPVIGDPEFYAARLKPLEDALATQVGRVKAEMTDAEVDEVYEKGAKVWIGLDHVIDELRRQWLLAKYTEM